MAKKKDRSRWTEREWIAHHKKKIEHPFRDLVDEDSEFYNQTWENLLPEEKTNILQKMSTRYEGKIPGSISDQLDGMGEKLHLPYKMEVRDEPLELEGRTAAKAFPDDPKQAEQVLRGLNPDVIDLRVKDDGSVVGRLPGEDFERKMDPGGWANLNPKEMVQDVADVGAELTDALGSYLAGRAGGGMAAVKGGPIGYAFGEAAGSGAASYGLEGLRQDLANYYNMSNKPRDTKKQALAATVSAAPGGLIGGGLLGKKALKSGFAKRNAPGLGWGAGAVSAAAIAKKMGLSDEAAGLAALSGGTFGKEFAHGITKRMSGDIDPTKIVPREVAEKKWADLTSKVAEPGLANKALQKALPQNPWVLMKAPYEYGSAYYRQPSLADREAPR